jgi:hypothetical protein
MLLKLRSMLSSAFARLDSIPHDNPNLNETTWFEIQPCSKVKLFGSEVVITQPSSTFLVYLLWLLTTSVGIYYLVIQENELSRLLWGWSLILWGIGALLAGTSYQAFGYQLKCEDRDTCRWSSWWEVIYMMFQQVSMSVMLVAVSSSCTQGKLFWWTVVYAVLCSLVYIVTTFTGGFKPIKSWITFERMVLVCAPIMAFFMILNGWRYFTLGEDIDLALLGSWFLLWLTMILFWIYDYLGWTKKLWEQKKIWFSENDVLHVVLIGWAVYMIAIAHYIVDF